MSKINNILLCLILTLFIANVAGAVGELPPPTNLHLVYQNDSSIKIAWDDTTSGSYAYKIYDENDNYIGFTQIDSLSFTHSGLTQHTTYGYKVASWLGGPEESYPIGPVFGFTDDDTIPPSFANFQPQQVTDAETNFIISCDITDESGVFETEVYLVWATQSDFSDSAEVGMELVSGDTYETVTSLPAQPQGSFVYYKVFAKDYDSDPPNIDADRAAAWSDVQIIPSTDDDPNPPTITFDPIIVTDSDNFFQIYCYISDYSGVESDSVYLEYDDNSAFSSPQTMAMIADSIDADGNGKYISESSFINSFSYFSGEDFYFRVYATDTDMDAGDPDDAASGYSSIQTVNFVDDDPNPPTFEDFSPSVAYETEPFQIIVTVSDTSGIYTTPDAQAPYLIWDIDGDLTDYAAKDTLEPVLGDPTVLQSDFITVDSTTVDFVYSVHVWDNDFDFNDPSDREEAISPDQDLTIADEDTIPPEVINTTTTIADSQNLVFDCQIVDASGIDLAYIQWRIDGGFQNVNVMTTSDGVNFQYNTSNSYPAGTQVTYSFVAWDADMDHAGDHLQTITSDFSMTIMDDDTNPPEFVEIEPMEMTDGTPLIISAKLYDASGIDSVYTLWDDDGNLGDGANKDTLFFVSDSLYQTENLGSYPVGYSGLIYQIYAFDGDDDFPGDSLTAVSDSFAINVVDDDTIPPILYNPQPTELSDGSGVVNFEVNAADSSGIDSVYVLWDYSDELAQHYGMQLIQGTEYDGKYQSQPFSAFPGTDVYFQFHAMDADNDSDGDNLSANTEMFMLTVTDDDTIGPAFSQFQPLSVMDSASFYVQCKITDEESGVYDDSTGSDGQGIYLRWDDDKSLLDGTYEQEIQMSLKSGTTNIYITEQPIPPQSIIMDSLFIYEVYAYDNDHDLGSAADRKQGRSGLQYLENIYDDDTTPPAFSDFQITPDMIYDTDPIEVSCTITDDSGIYDDDTGPEGQGVYLVWDTDGDLENGYESSVTLSRLDTSDVFATDNPIPTQPATSNFLYKVYAHDDDYDGYVPTELDRQIGESDAQSLTIYDDDTDAPYFVSFSPDSVSDGGMFQIQAVIMDSSSGIDENQVDLFWDNQTETDSVAMQRMGQTNTFVAYNIPSQIPGTNFSYYIRAYDSDNDWTGDQLYSVSQPQNITIYDDDTSPPEFIYADFTDEIDDGGTYYIYAGITDESGVLESSVYLEYSDEDTSFTLGMSEESPGIYVTNDTLPQRSRNAVVQYRVFAEDSDMDNGMPGDQSSDWSDWQIIEIDDDDTSPPLIQNPSPDSLLYDDENLVFEATITDPSGVWDGFGTAGTWVIWNDGTPHSVGLDADEDDSTHFQSPSIGTFDVGTEINYRIFSYDNDTDLGDPTDRKLAITDTIDFVVIDDDVNPPVVSNVYSAPGFLTQDYDFHVFCDIADESGVDEDNAYLEYDGQITIPLIHIGGNTYRTQVMIPSQPIGEFPFEIYAIDLDTDHPGDQSDTTYTDSFMIADNDTLPPEISNIYSEPDSLMDFEHFHVFATISDDDSDVDTSSVYLETSDGDSIPMHPISYSVYRTDTNVDAQPAGWFEFSIYAADTDDEGDEIPNSITVVDSFWITDDDTLPPVISDVYSDPADLTDGITFNVFATITDFSGIDPQNVSLNYGDESIPMEVVSGSLYSTSTPVPAQPSPEFEFEIIAFDADDDHIGDQLSTIYEDTFPISDDDTAEPQISNVHSSPSTLNDATEFHVYATLTDESGISEAALLYDDAYIPMIADSVENLYHTETPIPPQPMGEFNFQILAVDGDLDHPGDSLQTYYDGQFEITDNDNESPEISNIHSDPTDLTDSDNFYIFCTITDESGVDPSAVYVEYGDSDQMNMYLISENLYRTEGLIDSQLQGLFEFSIYAADVDTLHNEAANDTTVSSSFTIADDDTLAPEFANIITQPSPVYDDSGFDVVCDISDESGILEDSAILFWDNDGELEEDYNEISMSPQTQTRKSDSRSKRRNIARNQRERESVTFITDEMIPAHSFGTTIVYQITASDNDFDNQAQDDVMEGFSEVMELTVADDDSAGPEFSDLPAEEMRDGEAFNLSCSITDESGVYDDETGSAGFGVYLLWDNDGELETDNNEVQMSPDGEDHYITDEMIPVQSYTADFVYEIFAYDDDFDNNNPDDRTQNSTDILHIYFVDDDSLPPTFSNFTTEPEFLDDMSSFYLSCEITDESGVYDESVYLLWSDSELFMDPIPVAMENIQGDVYRTVTQIPPQSTFYYKVVAADNDFDNDDPADRTEGQTDLRSIEITDDDQTAPQFSNFAPTDVMDTENFHISCTISDESGIYDDDTGSDGYGVYLRWDYDGEVEDDYHGEALMSPQVAARLKSNSRRTERSGREDVVFITDEPLGLQPSSKGFYYRVYAYDNDYDNSNPDDRTLGISSLQSIEIIDDDDAPPVFSNFYPKKIISGLSFYLGCDISDSTGIYYDEDAQLYDPANPTIPFNVTLIWDNDGEIEIDWKTPIRMMPKGEYTTSAVEMTFETVEKIPAQTEGSEFVYAVYAMDTDLDGDYATDAESASSLTSQGLPQEIAIQEPGEFEDAYVYPNPAPNDKYPEDIHFRYFVEEDGTDISIQVFDVLGDLIWETHEYNLYGNDYHESLWEIRDVASGLYIFRIEATSSGGTREVIKKLAIRR